MIETTNTNTTENNQPDPIGNEAKQTIRVRREETGPWIEVKLHYRGTLWAHVDDGTEKFRVQWKDVHPDDKFDYQQ